MSTEQGGARLFDLGYRRYDGERQRPARAIGTLALFTAKRVLGLGRGGRHKVLPVITLVVAYLPALASVLFAVILDDLVQEDLITYGEYTFIIGASLALFAALVAPEALCPDRRSGMLGLYLAGPLDRTRYVLAKAIGVYVVMLLIALGPLLFMLVAFVLSGFGPALSEIPGLLVRILAAGGSSALLYTALALAVSSFTTRRAAAAVATILLLYVPLTIARSAIESSGAPAELDLASFPFVASELSYRIFGETGEDEMFIGGVSTSLVTGSLLGWSALALLVCWARYRRIEAFR